MRGYNYKPTPEIKVIIRERIMLIGLMILTLLIAVSLVWVMFNNGVDEYSKHVCMVTTGDELCR